MSIKMPNYRHPNASDASQIAAKIHARFTNLGNVLDRSNSLLNNKNLERESQTQLAEALEKIQDPRTQETMSDVTKDIVSAHYKLQAEEKMLEEDMGEMPVRGVDYNPDYQTVAIRNGKYVVEALPVEAIQSMSNKTDTGALQEVEEYNTERAQKYLNDFRKLKIKGYPSLTDKQIAAIVGNLHHESSGFTKYYQSGMSEGSGGEGDAQWTAESRKTAFLKYASDNNLDSKSYEANFQFIVKELTENRRHGFQNKQFYEEFFDPNASVEKLTSVFENYYLSAGNKLMSDRILDATAYLMSENEEKETRSLMRKENN